MIDPGRFTNHRTFSSDGEKLQSAHIPSIRNLKLLLVTSIWVWLSCASTRNIPFHANALKEVNRNLILDKADPYKIGVERRASCGVIILNNLDFNYGVLEMDLQSEDISDAIGIAFNIENDSIYECVGFQPLSNPENQVQYAATYIAKPGWQSSGYESGISHNRAGEFSIKADPAGWITIRLKITPHQVIVWDKKNINQRLELERPASSVSKKVGLWAGPNSSGYLKNLNLIKVNN
ncbi:MAG: hypothetical protein KDC80_12385 [Saprospiraceae bacterium]|nr:hypothetical protein [Saprospiraceae bacterium]